MMLTDELIAGLSAAPPPARLASPTRTVLVAALLACLVVALVAFAWLGLRSDIGTTLTHGKHEFLLNLVFVIGVGSVALAIIRDLAVPGRTLRLPAIAIIAPFLVIAVVAVHELSSASLHQLFPHDDNASWLTCLWQTAALAVPAFTILAFGIRRLAPTNLRRAGFYVGLLAGAIGSMGFCLHAPSNTVTFGASVYTAGIMLMAIIGAWIGPRLLRWR